MSRQPPEIEVMRHGEPQPELFSLPEPVDRELRSRIRAVYDSAVDNLGPEDENYVDQKLERVVGRLITQDTVWLRRLGQIAEALQEARHGKCNAPSIPPALSRHILAALFYLCNPFDVIPDFTPGRGYVDDALVMQRCLAQIQNRHTSLYRWIVRRCQADQPHQHRRRERS